MNLQTQISFSKETRNPISYDSNILLLGSCFSENIGNKFNYFKFQHLQNPLGILFHPRAIENLILNSINQKEYLDKDVFQLNEQWQSFEAHSELNSTSKDEILSKLNNRIKRIHDYITKASHIIITLGTAWVYRHIESDTIVTNCHKVPQNKFLKELLSIDEISESLEAIMSLIQSVNPDASIIFTISPVRHLKDGFTENQQSKSHLISALHQIIEPSNKIYYFPSYELMMDELRDYRFYKEDLIHPNQTAIDYIWEKFLYTWVSDTSTSMMEKVDAVQKGLNHKPFNPNSESHKKFRTSLELKISELQQEFPHIHF